MKLIVELTDEHWKFYYEIGETNCTATRPIDADTVLAFSSILKYAREAASYENKEVWKVIEAKAWIEQNPKEAFEFAKEKLK